MKTEGLTAEAEAAASSGQFKILKKSFEVAQAAALALATNPGTASKAELEFKQFALNGMGAIYDNCSDFFTNAGEREKYIYFTRDLVALGGTVAAGIIALTGGSKTAVGGIALGTGTVYGGLDVYTKNFLFGAENISSVRALITNALDAHEKAVLADSSAWDFNNAMRVVLDHQDICRPSRIVALVKEAIQKGDVQAKAQTDTEGLIDRTAELEIASDAGHPTGSIPTKTELAGLYWTFVVRPEPAEFPSIAAMLNTLPLGSPFSAAGARNPNWNSPRESRVATNLTKLSAGTKDQLLRIIAAEKEAQTPAIPAAPPVAVVPVPAPAAPAPAAPAAVPPPPPAPVPGAAAKAAAAASSGRAPSTKHFSIGIR